MRQSVLDAEVPRGNVGRAEIPVHREHRAGLYCGASDLPAREDRPGEAPVQLLTDEGDRAGGDVAGTRNGIHKSSGGRGIQSSSEGRRSLLGGEDVKALQRVNDGGAAPEYGPATARDVPGEAQPRPEILRLGLIGGVNLLPYLHHSQVRIEAGKLVVSLLDRRHELVAQSQVQGQPRRDAPVILKESRISPVGDGDDRVSDKQTSP